LRLFVGGIAYHAVMLFPFNDDEELTEFPVFLDDVTTARLLELSEAIKVAPSVLIASMIHDVLEDDANSHDKLADVLRRNANHDLQ